MMRDALASFEMRTTLNIDDDILQVAKELGRRGHKSVGEVVSELARQSLTRSSRPATAKEEKAVYGFRALPRVPGKIVTNDMINQLRDEDSE